MHVSVIVPAHNAASTLPVTLESLIAQTFTAWEAIVVDDGSADETLVVATAFARRDKRLRVLSQDHAGVSAARNAAVAGAGYDWLLFLDADDLLLPAHLEQMVGTLSAAPALDAVHCGWARLASDGAVFDRHPATMQGDLFAAFVADCVFAIHACVVRRSLVTSVGGFDTSLRICEDWDLWQRVARTGAQFGAVPEVLALYRCRPQSASTDALRLLVDGLEVIGRGHGPDLRVPAAHPAHAAGLPPDLLPAHQYGHLSWCAGMALHAGQDALALLDTFSGPACPELDPNDIAHDLVLGALSIACDAAPSALPMPALDAFLAALETRTAAAGLARSARTLVDRLILERCVAERPALAGATYAVCVEVTEPIPDIFPPPSAQRIYCDVELSGTRLGALELPVFAGHLPRYVLADAIAAEFAWQILHRFLQEHVYGELEITRDSEHVYAGRGGERLAQALGHDGAAVLAHVHEQAGWTIFLQELWGRPAWPPGRFYDPGYEDPSSTLLEAQEGRIAIELSHELPDVEVSAEQLQVAVSLGGVAVGAVSVPAPRGRVRAQQLRVAVTRACGFELCRVAVREGILGRPPGGLPGLRGRLAAAASAPRLPHERQVVTLPLDAILAPGWIDAVERSVTPGVTTVLIARRTPGEIDTGVSRRAVLPAALFDEVDIAGREVLVRLDSSPAAAGQAVYVPDLIPLTTAAPPASAEKHSPPRPAQALHARQYGRSLFEATFASGADPWRYSSQYEQTKYEQTLAMLPAQRIGRALELACAEGHFTCRLAPRVDELVAADISQLALERAAVRCEGLRNIRFVRLDMLQDTLPGQFDLIVCSEVLYFMGDRQALAAVARKLARALQPGGYLITAHANLIVDEPDRPGFDWGHPFGAKVIGETLARTPSLYLERELRTPLYRIQCFRRRPRLRLPLRRRPSIVELPEQPTPLLPEVAAHVRWTGGGRVSSGEGRQVETGYLPLLMYHSVAETGAPALARYRVSPAAFDEQLCFLRDAGYYSITLEDWQAAMAEHKPLPGRAVLITFDDGYKDFLTYAWPLLKRHGFSATVFLVADAVGAANHWDCFTTGDAPLLGWPEIAHLRREGVRFGSHSAGHARLAALPPSEIARELLRSRAILEDRLGEPVRAVAYPYGSVDAVVQHLAGAAGYTFGLTCRPGRSSLWDSLLALPRIEVTGSDTFQDFVAKLG